MSNRFLWLTNTHTHTTHTHTTPHTHTTHSRHTLTPYTRHTHPTHSRQHSKEFFHHFLFSHFHHKHTFTFPSYFEVNTYRKSRWSAKRSRKRNRKETATEIRYRVHLQILYIWAPYEWSSALVLGTCLKWASYQPTVTHCVTITHKKNVITHSMTFPCFCECVCVWVWGVVVSVCGGVSVCVC